MEVWIGSWNWNSSNINWIWIKSFPVPIWVQFHASKDKTYYSHKNKTEIKSRFHQLSTIFSLKRQTGRKISNSKKLISEQQHRSKQQIQTKNQPFSKFTWKRKKEKQDLTERRVIKRHRYNYPFTSWGKIEKFWRNGKEKKRKKERIQIKNNANVGGLCTRRWILTWIWSAQNN